MSNSARKIHRSAYGINNKLGEFGLNREASDYISENYEVLVRDVLKLGIDPIKNYDLVNDVYTRVLEKEYNGECYDSNKGKTGPFITVSQYVWGLLQGYSKNKRYQRISLNDPVVREFPSDGGNEDNPNAFQLAYINAESYDNIEDLDNTFSVLKEIEYILEFEPQIKLNIRFFIRNLREIAEEVSSKSINKNLFGDIKAMARRDRDFAEAIASVISFSGKHPVEFEAMVASL